ncbi:EF2563 family selenium-dependent molybdenum hydroxylase system protein [Heliobacterium gestii]|uniref:EF2563 family selenium-dependent molybdenum hydroxylase system protein n=1 Tax=Heliomicrobium gestii TaxID=2699 RepID=A0A845LHP2_HELGE|nr:selenium-dependent molybdenum cofactor biosynthesis protein YqeB [Heliomicrobium gestii]MBM7866963.1 xanthine dehydrogenase accessory factor [Heliomicrobium gestii]MZP42386.1 EF2563 family selenium-dependent molybdenum hydroxylase system protein [Heliomicrobium gestii]
MRTELVLIKGAGDLASGVAHRLVQCGFIPVMTELAEPLVVRRTVSFAEAVYSGETTVEGVRAVLTEQVDEALKWRERGVIPVLIDPDDQAAKILKPTYYIEATLRKQNNGLARDRAPFVIALGPGFCAGRDVHAVIETKRGHDLGRVIYEGVAIADTGIPGEVGGYRQERLLRAPTAGRFSAGCAIGDQVAPGETVGTVDGQPVRAQIAGIVRGLVKDGITVTAGLKIGDVDPRLERSYCASISDKARAIGGGVLEAMLHLALRRP